VSATARELEHPFHAHRLPCAHCGERTAKWIAPRSYRCQNPKWRGASGSTPGPYISILMVDAIVGACLEPWASATALERCRRENPRHMIQHKLPVKDVRLVPPMDGLPTPELPKRPTSCAAPRLQLVTLGGKR
jgi:hypothetical protein